MKLIECVCSLGTPSEFQFPPRFEVARYLLTSKVTEVNASCVRAAPSHANHSPGSEWFLALLLPGHALPKLHAQKAAKC